MDAAADVELLMLQTAFRPAYELERELGRGGMATVFLAADTKHERKVAIKVLHEHLASATGLERFLREISLTARLSHPHILPLLDSGVAAERPYYVMPFVSGESLRQRLERERRVPIVDALRITAQVADALAYAHAQGAVHRDIKPENIMLSGRHALVADFGIARAIRAAASSTTVADDSRMTRVGLLIGTPAYMSPEQAVGDEAIDGRSDVCSLGVVLFEMLVGQLPFDGPNAHAIIARQITQAVPSASAINEQVPVVVDELLATAMAREPSDRFASAAEFADSLSALEREIDRGIATNAKLTTHVPHTPSIAVLPFDNLSSDPENVYLSDGIAEDVLTLLSRRPALRVCARSSSFAFRDKGIELRTLGERLGVRHVLTGSVRRAGDRLRIGAQLVNAADGTQLWGERYERRTDDIFAIQDEIAAAIVDAINAALLARGQSASLTRPIAAKPTANVEAYELCLRGRHLWGQRTATSAQRSIECFEQAIALDTGYTLAWSGLANVWATLGVYGSRAPEESMVRARDAASAALALDSACAEAHTTLGLVSAAFDWEWANANASFQRAISLNPGYPTAHQWYATNYLVPHARFDDAFESLRMALRFDPLSLALKASTASACFYARRYNEAATAAREALDIDDAFPPAYFFLGQALMHLGEHDAGLAACEIAAELAGRSGETLAVVGHARAVTGDEDGARALLMELNERAKLQYVSPTHPALIHVGLGEWNASLSCLERAVDVRAADLTWIGVRPHWDALRSSPRFQVVLDRVGVGRRAPTMRE